jgi:hypothetical protein
MTKKLEEEFNLPPIEDFKLVVQDDQPEEPTVDSVSREILVTQGTMELTDRVDAAIPMVQGLEQLDRELDDYASKAMQTFEELVDLGKNVEDRHAAPIFDSASKMLTAALQAKQAKINKKLDILNIQLKKAKLDLDTRKLDASLKDDEDEPEEISGKVVSGRTEMLAELMANLKKNDK